jgi:membrane peptidoglycan carboxypeptidase
MRPASLDSSTIIRTRAKRRNRIRHNPVITLGWGLALCFSLALVGAIFALTWGYLSLVRGLPSALLLPMLVDGAGAQLRQPTRLLDRSGTQVILTLQDPAASNNYLLLEAFPPAVITATLGSADPDFWLHPGYHLLGKQPLTLAERLVTDLLLWDEPATPRREWRAHLLAGQVTARYGRKKILEWVLNSAPYGPGVHGLDAAARAYLGKSATALTLAEAAFLAAASERPAIHPVQAAELTIQRQTEILLELSANGLISPLESLQASQEKLPLQPPEEMVSLAPDFTDLALEQLATQIPPERLARGGLKVITSLDLDLQTQAACAVQAQQARLVGQPSPDCEAARLLPTIFNITPLTTTLDTAAVILNPQTGQVLALVGGASGEDNKHPGGSLLTPLVYLSAFARGSGPATLAWDVPGEPGIENFDGHYHGPLRLRTALANDYPVPAAQLFDQLGAAEVWRTLGQFGLIPTQAGESFLDFSQNPVALLEAAHALSALANQGTLTGQALDGSPQLHPVSVLSVESVDGRPWLDWHQSQRRPVVGVQLAYLLNHVLSDEPAHWPSLGHPNPLEIGRPAAVKLSQTPGGSDTWAVGATPQRLVSVWVGRPAEGSDPNRLSPMPAAAIWHALMQYASRQLPVQTWEAPAGVVTLAVCDPSGLLPTIECPNVVNEVFIAGNEPTRLDDLYRSVPVNRISGLLATVFTPPSLVEERVYLSVPPQAVVWAQQAGLPIPPSSYDIINLPPVNPKVVLTSPANFDQVRGQVLLHGTASGDDFDSYRLLVGAGLNPQRWLQIGDESSRPVENGLLGQWDASGLSGLYAIQLQVVRKDSRIETAILQVTVDNQPPEVRLFDPETPWTPTESGFVFLQADANDDLALARLEFWVDDALAGALYPQFGERGPFTLAWAATPGRHRLQVIAFDRAGNSNQAEGIFEVQQP